MKLSHTFASAVLAAPSVDLEINFAVARLLPEDGGGGGYYTRKGESFFAGSNQSKMRI
jgi:hypothetical protein